MDSQSASRKLGKRRRHIAIASAFGFSLTPLPVLASVTVSPGSLSCFEGLACNGTVATFTTTDAIPSLANFSVTIGWGDSTQSTGNIISSTPAGTFAITGTHTYAEEGSYFTLVTVSDFSDSSSGAVVGTASVQDAPLNGISVNFASTSGRQFSGVVARFTDQNPNPSISDFIASINWGDGNSSSGSTNANPKGGFDVTGIHIYTSPGLRTATIVINDIGGASATVLSYTGDRIFVNGFDG